MKFLSVAVVLISLLVIVDLAYSAPNCGSHGVQDTYANDYCSCYSGYAPSDQTQTDCNTPSRCPAHEPIDTRTSVGGYPPFLYNATFKADRYNVIVRIPLVEGRRNATVRFKTGAPSCGYPGNMWLKQANGKDCFDELIGSLPWTANSMCGFNKVSTPSTVSYLASIVVSYDDHIKDSQGAFVRTLSVGLNVNVTFVTRTSIIFSLINLTPGSTLLTVTVVGNVIYDANTNLASVTLQTAATWPYQVESVPNIFSTPMPNTASIGVDALYDLTTVCTNSTSTTCYQQYVMRINPNTGCNLGGNYVFNITLSCRSNACGSTFKAGAYSVLVYNTDVCGVGGVDVSLANGVLVPFTDSTGSTPSSTFTPNQDVYFAFTLSSDAVTIDNIVPQKITASAGSTTDVLFDNAPVGTPAGIQTKGTLASLSFIQAVLPASPGTPATVWFHVKLVDAVTSFRVLPNAAATVTISIIVDITYHGNTKRTVEVAFEANAAASSTSSQGVADIYIAEQTGEEGSFLMPSAAVAVNPISVFVVVSLVLMLILNF